MIDGHLWGAQPVGLRVTNLLLQAGCAALVGLIAWRAAGKMPASGLAAAALFALHPVHAEPVLWITGRVDVLATLFYLAVFGAFLRFRLEGGTGEDNQTSDLSLLLTSDTSTPPVGVRHEPCRTTKVNCCRGRSIC